MANILDHRGPSDIIYDKIQVLVDKLLLKRKKDGSMPINFLHPFSEFQKPFVMSGKNLIALVSSQLDLSTEDENTKEVEVHKVTYLLDLFRRLKSPRDQTMKACVNTVLAQIDRIKACYEGEMKTYDDHELTTMMVIDACFILELVYKSKVNDYEGHSFFDNNLLTLYVKHDLVLLENQIPFFVLESIFECTIRKFRPIASLTELFLSFLNDINPFHNDLVLQNERVHTDCDHILRLLQKSYHPSNAMQSEILEISKSAEKFSNAISYSVAELCRAGVKFKPYKDENWLLAIEFKSSRVSCLIWS